MRPRILGLWQIAATVWLLAAGQGCNLITGLDSVKYETGGTSAGGTTTTSTGAGGTTNSTGGTGTIECMDPAECPPPPSECVVSTCEDGKCGTMLQPEGTEVTQTAGNCNHEECDASGNPIGVPDDNDLPIDGSDCTEDVCTNGNATNPALNAGVSCSSGGGQVCNGVGSCVECVDAVNCPGADTECQTRTCDSFVCGTSNAMKGTLVAAQTLGDCLKNQCDGSGSIETVPDDSDPEDDGNECTTNACSGGIKVTTDVPANTPCGVGGALACDGMGKCLGCMDPMQCGVPGNQCLTATCILGACGTATKMDGAPCNDGTQCTQTDTCAAGMCSGTNPVICTQLDQCHDVGTCAPATGTCSDPSKPDGTACADGDACTMVDTCKTGLCTGENPVMCMQLDQCHQVGSCNPVSGTCSNPNAPDGTPCMVGMSSGTCASGVCMVGGACNDNMKNGNETGVDCGGPDCVPCANGNPCNVNGDCLSTHCVAGFCHECATAADCPAADTDCQTPTCDAAHVCGVSFEPNGTALPPASQIAGNCIQVQCDGNGGTQDSVDDTDVPIDGNECTDDKCTLGVPSNPNLPVGFPCMQGGGTQCDGLGSCGGAPIVTATAPPDGSIAIATSATIEVTFSTPMSPPTLAGQTSPGPCTGTIQVSSNDFSHCIAFTSVAPVMSGNDTIATFTPMVPLFSGTTYRIRVTTAALSAVGLPLAFQYTHNSGFATLAGPTACDGRVVISQVYAGGGNSGAPFMNDFVELHNLGNTPVDLAGTSVQYAAATNANWMSQVPLSGIVQPGGYFLVQLGGGVQGMPLPPADIINPAINMGQSSGKISFVRGTTPLPAAFCPDPNRVIDFVGYGTANCYEGTGATPLLSNILADFRLGNGCIDTNASNADFGMPALPAPRNSASPPAFCTCNAVANETDQPAEADYCALQFPVGIMVPTNQPTPPTYGRIFENLTTPPANGAPNVIAQVGYGPNGSNPQVSTAWLWFPSTFNTQVGNDDEYQQSFIAPAPGQYVFTWRFSFDGMQWTYCDLDGAGSNPGLDFSPMNIGVLSVTP